MDTEHLDPDNLEALNTILPTEEEIRCVQSEARKPIKDRMVFDEPEAFVFEVHLYP